MKISKYNHTQINIESWKTTFQECEPEHKQEIKEIIKNYNEENFSHLDFYEIKKDNVVIARCCFNIESSTIAGLVVSKGYRNKGYGTKLINHIIKKKKKARLYTRVEYVMKICDKLNFKFFGNIISDLGNIESEYIFIGQ